MSTLRFLLLEDDPSDAEAIQTMLMDSGMDYELLRVETLADFVAALETETFDLILAKCGMPNGDGMAALEIATALCSESPFIAIAASLYEERAIALLNQGATDYVLKPRLGRLVSAVQRALREAVERREQQTALRERQRTEQMLVEQKHLLKLIALGHPLDECLAAVCASVAQLSPCTRACFLLTDAQRLTFPRSITPNFPPSFGQGLKDAPINELAISTCGTAVYCGKPITCEDIAQDDRWSQGWRDLCIAHEILACHSTPVMRTDNLPVGSLMLCFDQARLPTDWERQLAEFGAQVASIVFEIVFERDRATIALRESEANYRTLFESVDQGFCICEMLFNENDEPVDYRFLSVNPSFSRLTGLKQATGKTARELIPNLESDWFEIYGKVVQTGEPVRFENQSTTMSRWFDVNAFRIGEPQSHQFAILFTNITEAKRDEGDRIQAEAELRESEARFRTLADNMSQLAWMADPNGWIFWYNHRWFEYTGTTLEEMQGWGWQQVHHPDHVDRVVEHFRRCIETGVQWEDTFPLRGKDGNYRWFLSRAIPIQDEAGNVVHWFGTNTDITDQKQLEAELRQKNAILDVVNQSAPTPIFVKDRQGRIIYANPATLEVLGKSAEEVVGYYDIDLYLSPEDAARVMENDQRIMETGQTEVVEESPDGIRTFLGMKAPYRNEAGEVIGLVGISNDISDRKRIEAEREQLLQQEQAARSAAEEANRIKDEFLAVVSHELRTPLNPILGWSKLLRSGKLTPEKSATALETIERNAQQQAQLIDDLLDISRILQNKLTLAIAPVDLAVTVTNALETVRLAAEAKGIELKFESADLRLVDSGDLQSTMHNPQFEILGDVSRLQQIIWNLLSNSIKFTPENGRVEVRLESGQGTREQGAEVRDQGAENDAGTHDLEPGIRNLKPGTRTLNPAPRSRSVSAGVTPNPETPYAQITISDTGKGILPKFLPHLFEAFRQEDATTTRKFGGLGLGLSIVQQLVALHGGTVTAASDGEGKGATFTVRLPISPHPSISSARSSTPRQSINLSGIQILVVDNIIDSQEFVVFVLEQAGAIVTPASSAQAAMELLAQVKPDVIISDIGMPNCNGYELLQQIRSSFIQLQTIPAIALSAYASEQDRQQALAAGFQRHLAKPIDPEALINTVALLTQLSE